MAYFDHVFHVVSLAKTRDCLRYLIMMITVLVIKITVVSKIWDLGRYFVMQNCLISMTTTLEYQTIIYYGFSIN